MVQLISVMYKDQQASTLQKLLNVWLEDALSDSSDDFESNTTPPQKENSGESSPVLTSDPTTSDSSDNGGNLVKCRQTIRFIHLILFIKYFINKVAMGKMLKNQLKPDDHKPMLKALRLH